MSYSGRVQLIQSVVFVITKLWMQCLPIPKKVIHRIDVICISLLWTGGKEVTIKSPISWKKVCSPKTNGGLNIIDLEKMELDEFDETSMESK